MQETLTIDIKNFEDDHYSLITFNGDFDKVGYNEVRDELSGFVKSFSDKYLLFDFSKLKFINSEGIGYLMEVHTHLAQRDRKFVIVGPNSHVADVFKTIGISEVVSIYPSVNDFLSKI